MRSRNRAFTEAKGRDLARGRSRRALCCAMPAAAETPILSAPQVQEALAQSRMVLIDIRTREEWAETGLAKGAFPVSMHEDDFGARLSQLLRKYGPDKIAMICATGGRTAHIGQLLENNGIRGVADVSEGMEGNRRGPGWIRRGLETVSLKEAMADYEAALAE